MTKDWRLILDGKGDGYYNMAVDEALLLNYPSQKIPTLRIYGWDEPFISLGYNQNSEKVLINQGEAPVVRRITGGSAIFHAKELTYSLTCALEDLNLPKGVKDSYKIVCSFLKVFYAQLGLKASFATDIIDQDLGRYGNFCFSSSQHFDLVIGLKKIGGNAQRRKKNIIFQHGSIPQKIDFVRIRQLIRDSGDLERKTIDLEGILGKDTEFFELAKLLAQSFEQAFGVKLKMGSLSSQEQISVNSLGKKYISEEWNRNSHNKFSYSAQDSKI
jgi:lipoate-protein ligase A